MSDQSASGPNAPTNVSAAIGVAGLSVRERPIARPDTLTGLFAVTLFSSAALVFFLEPMFAKMVLPLLGGSPAVWNTCVVFFQAAMLGGYAYAHLTTSWLTARQQAVLHALLLLLVAFSLPVVIPGGWIPPVDRTPVPWLLSLLLIAVGGPFFVVSATAPLLQKWFSNTDHPSAADPYFLYSASNVGSILALLGYPFLVEPSWSLSYQSRIWTGGYALFAAMTLACAVAALRRPSVRQPAAHPSQMDSARDHVTPLTWTRRARWLALSAVPSSLMLAVTTHVSTDIAAVPLLWTVPLTLYLLSFVLGFASTPLVSVKRMAAVMPAVVLPLVLSMIAGITGPARWLMPLHLAVFFVCALILHTELARSRPATRDLTEFYLWMAAGGVLGGLFNTFVAPLAFTSVVEYPVALALACALRPQPIRAGGRRRWLVDGVALAVLAAATAGMTRALQAEPVNFSVVAPLFGLTFVSYFSLAARPISFGLGVALMMLAAGGMSRDARGDLLFAQRTFFGVHRVRLEPKERQHVLYHGSTVHGQQRLDPRERREPLSYYHRSGPIGQVMDALSKRLDNARIGVVGLGAGSLAAYARAGQLWTFFEIDPTIERIARTPSFFTYLSDCGDLCDVELGDARLSLARAADASYDLLVLDAFSSDAIPVHLVTREALGLYLSKIANDGVLAFHLSNRHLHLQPVLGALAADRGLSALTQFDRSADTISGRFASEWLVMARSPETFGALRNDSRWVVPEAGGGRVWTDDFSDIFGVLK